MSRRIRDEAELEQAFEAERYLLFKHSQVCPVSAAAFARYRRWTEAHPDEPTGWIDVIAERALARAVAERTGVKHESPQAIWLKSGDAVWNESHGGITEESLSLGGG